MAAPRLPRKITGIASHCITVTIVCLPSSRDAVEPALGISLLRSVATGGDHDRLVAGEVSFHRGQDVFATSVFRKIQFLVQGKKLPVIRPAPLRILPGRRSNPAVAAKASMKSPRW